MRTILLDQPFAGEEFRRLLEAHGARAVLAGGAALYREAEKIMAASKQIVPVDTGNLRNTGHVAPPDFLQSSVSVEMGYGGPAAPYAIYVHERLDLRHKAGQYAKFLEFPALQAVSGMEERLAAEIRAELERAA